MGYLLASSPCNCAILIQTPDGNLIIEDSNLLPSEDINIGWIKFNGVQYDIDQVFLNVSELISYLNTTFVSAEGLDGFFSTFNDFIDYSNPEGFLTAEIMIMLQAETLYFGMLPGYPIPNKDYEEVPESNIITHASLVNKEVLQVHVNTISSLPITATGWESDEDAGTITFPADNIPSGQLISVLVRQKTN